MSVKKKSKTDVPATVEGVVKAEKVEKAITTPKPAKASKPAKAGKPEKKAAKGAPKTSVFAALVQGAREGLTGEALFGHIQAQRADVNSRRIAKAGLKALGDSKLTEKPVLDAIYELVIAHRVSGKTDAATNETGAPTAAAGNDNAPRKKPRKKAA